MQQRIKGFMLAETMLGLLVTVFSVMIMQNLVLQLKTGAQSNFRDDQLAFAYVQLDRFLKGEKNEVVYMALEESTPKQAVLYKGKGQRKKEDQQKYIIQQYRNMVRVTTPESGHMPLVLRVAKARFKTEAGYLQIDIDGQDGRKSELRFKVKDKRDENKNKQNKG